MAGIFSLILVNTLGANYLTLSLGIFAVILLASHWNFNEGYKAGCFLVILSILAHADSPNPYIQGRILQTILGVILGVFFSLLFEFQSAAYQLEQALIKTLENQKKLFTLIIEQTLNQEDKTEQIRPLFLELRKTLKNHFDLVDLTQKNWTNSLFIARQKQHWHFLINSQILLFRHLGYLHRVSLDLLNQPLTPELYQQIQALREQALREFEQVLQLIKSPRIFQGNIANFKQIEPFNPVLLETFTLLLADEKSYTDEKSYADLLPRLVFFSSLGDLLNDLSQAKHPFTESR